MEAVRKKKPAFKRKDWNKKPKLGKGRKNIIKWVRARGRHNKIRERRKGHSKAPIIGYSQAKSIRGKLQNLVPVLIYNMKQLEALDKGKEIAVIARVGTRKKIQLAEKAKESGIKATLDLEKYIEESKKKFEERVARRKETVKQRKEREEKAKKKADEDKAKGKEESKSDEKKEKTEEQKVKEKKAEQDMLLKKSMEKEKHLRTAPKQTVIKRKALEK